MLYSLDQLPPQVIKLSPEYQNYWFNAYKSAFDLKSNDWLAIKTAWKVVQSVASLPHDLPLYITKANLDAQGRMQFQATASDTKKDTYDERMSLELFSGFIEDFSGEEFVSLSHYPRLDSKRGELGLIEKIYIDGNFMKIKGYFHNSPLATAAYNAIRKDRRDNVPIEKRIRVSIGFYDRKHKHGDNLIWEASDNGPCAYCMMGMEEKIYLRGKLDHCALTRVPANRRTLIEVNDE